MALLQATLVGEPRRIKEIFDAIDTLITKNSTSTATVTDDEPSQEIINSDDILVLFGDFPAIRKIMKNYAEDSRLTISDSVKILLGRGWCVISPT